MISTLLIANRGEIARRIARTASLMGMGTVAVYAEGDRDAPFVREADRAVALPGRSAAETYLDVEAIVAAALSAGADAVHPGYGFLSERAEFARAVTTAGLLWVGPPPEAIAAMGDKVAAKKLMAEAGVPVLPTWDPDDPAITYPVLVKAAAGGGGKGMRIVTAPSDLVDAVAAARREAAAAFGDPTVFLERYVTGARHVEIQILADGHGRVLHCFERECSVQRRHQKIIEECPSPAVDADLRARMGDAAVAAAAAVGYRSAGTVEFVLEPGGDFWFLEVNTRLQVEHPVTEEVTGLDLVREQLLVAQGEPLSVPAAGPRIDGHAIEARIYAEDPAAGFLPATGVLVDWRPAADPAVRWDSGVEAGDEVGVEFDPMLAKVVSHAPTRREAALRLARALERSVMRGVTTNRDYLVAALRSEAFLSGDTTTEFVERAGVPAGRQPGKDELAVAATAVALAMQARSRRSAMVLRTLPSGWRNSVMPPEAVTFAHPSGRLEVTYRSRRDGGFDFAVGERHLDVRNVRVEQDRVGFEAGGRAYRLDVLVAGERAWAQGPDGDVELHVEPRFPHAGAEEVEGALLAPMPGRVIAVEVSAGSRVEAGQLLMVVEAMKMEHRVVAPAGGTVTAVQAGVGDQVGAGDLLVVLDRDAEGS
ncbi:MAG TPA: biotin carboxylase N-terminal domain-containing protein [Acidimicrobiales bacterium]|nr:biotin carboxylase N-terminal domain-containing protein [Acidimicrobiales bacterium]